MALVPATNVFFDDSDEEDQLANDSDDELMNALAGLGTVDSDSDLDLEDSDDEDDDLTGMVFAPQMGGVGVLPALGAQAYVQPGLGPQSYLQPGFVPRAAQYAPAAAPVMRLNILPKASPTVQAYTPAYTPPQAYTPPARAYVAPTVQALPQPYVAPTVGVRVPAVGTAPTTPMLAPARPAPINIVPVIPAAQPTKVIPDLNTLVTQMAGINITGVNPTPTAVAADIDDFILKESSETAEQYEVRRALTVRLASIQTYKLNPRTAVVMASMITKKTLLGVTYDPDTEAGITYLLSALQS